MLLFIITTHDMHHHGFMYDERYKNINSQANGSIKYISNIDRGTMKTKIYYNQIMINNYSKVFVKIYNR